MTESSTTPVDARREQTPLRRFYSRNGRAVNSAMAFVCVWLFFASQNWGLFLNPGFYGSYLFSVPPSIILVTALVFVVTAGEIDLSFPAVIGAGGSIFMTLLIWGMPTLPAALLTLVPGGAGCRDRGHLGLRQDIVAGGDTGPVVFHRGYRQLSGARP